MRSKFVAHVANIVHKSLLQSTPLLHLFLPPFRFVEALFRVLFLVCGGVSVHDMHAVNTVVPLLPEVPDKKVYLMFRYLWWLHCCSTNVSVCPSWRGLRPLHSATWVNEGFVAYAGGGEGFASQVCYPVTDLVITRREEAALFTVKGVTDGELWLTSVTVRGKVRGIQAIPQEEGVASFLGPHLRPIDCGWLHCKPGPGLYRSLQATCVQDQGFLQCGRQCLLRPNLSASPHGLPTLLEAGQVVCRLELQLYPEYRN